MEEELPGTVSHMATSLAMARQVYDSALKESRGARQSNLIQKVMTGRPVNIKELEPAVPGLYSQQKSVNDQDN